MSARKTAHSHHHIFGPGDVIFSEGEQGALAYVVQRGRINLTRQVAGQRTQVATLGPGEIIGERALMDDAQRLDTATAAEESELLVVDRDLLRRRLGAADPMLRLVVRALLDRVRQLPPVPGEAVRPTPPSAPPEAMGRGRGRVERRAIGLVKLEQELRQGLGRGEFELLLQPIVDLASRRTAGFEALMAWHHPSRGRLSPTSFIAVAERSGLIRDLDDLALRLASRALKRLRRAGSGRRPPLQVSVNLSGVQAEHADTVERVSAVLRDEDIDPGAVTLEITESWLVSEPEYAQGVLSGLKNLGLRLALDDFGTGYSSLAYLQRFPIDYLKVDRSFAQTMLTSESSAKIVRAVIALAHTFGLMAIAEGIDDPAQIAILRQMGCEFGQGYYFSRPLEIDQAAAYLGREAS